MYHFSFPVNMYIHINIEYWPEYSFKNFAKFTKSILFNKNRLWHRLCINEKFLRTIFFNRTPLVAASEQSQKIKNYKFSLAPTGLENTTSLAKWPVWLNGWVFVYKLSGCGFESSCSHLNFRFRACFEQGVSWHSGNYRVWIHSETRAWHDKIMQL